MDISLFNSTICTVQEKDRAGNHLNGRIYESKRCVREKTDLFRTST